MLTFKTAATATAIGAAGFVAGNAMLQLADKLMKFVPLTPGTLPYKVGRGLAVLFLGEWLLSLVQQKRGFGIIPVSLLADNNVMAFVGGWGPGTLIPIAKDLGLPLANAGDFDKFVDTLVTGGSLMSEADMAGVKMALANGMAQAGQSNEKIAVFNDTPMSDIASQLMTAIPEMEKSLAEMRAAAQASQQ